MGKIKAIIKLMRPRQYYKNALVFLGAIFAERLLGPDLSELMWTYTLLIIGFICFCLISSSNYIINDIIDMPKDKMHEEKKNRPLASGEISRFLAIILFIICLFVPLGISLYISYLIDDYWFFIFVLLIFITGQIYNLYFKNISIVDILTLSVNYIWRALGGCILVNILISPWLSLTVFLGALFLVLCKRRSDLQLIGEEDAHKHKPVYEIYNIKLLDQLITASTAALLMDYCIYSVNKYLFYGEYYLISLPVFFYIIFRYLTLTYTKEHVARKTERAFLDKGMIIGGGIFIVLIFIITYFPEVLDFISTLPRL
ncbi:MAG: UbiA prenyltransferase family protein [Candidatus Helarchaeota archaeon]